MKKHHYILALIVVLGLTNFMQAQEGTNFDYQIRKIDESNYELNLHLYNTENVQYIEIDFLEQGNLLVKEIASLNKKKDGKYYIFFNNEERIISPDDFFLTFTQEFGLLKVPALMVRLVTKDFVTIDSYQQIIID